MLEDLNEAAATAEAEAGGDGGEVLILDLVKDPFNVFHNFERHMPRTWFGGSGAFEKNWQQQVLTSTNFRTHFSP
jgi:hypothetical protein